jgi:hypothetical protein
MAGKINAVKLMKRHRMMLEFQEQIKPFTPTVRELMELWGVNTTSAVCLALGRMEELGIVVTRRHGERQDSYYAIEPWI